MSMGLIAGYWHKNGLELYRYVRGKPVRIAGGPLESLSPVRGVLQRNVLIVGRDRLLHVRKRYPPASKEKLMQAVSLELGELFPFSRPDYFCRVFRSSSAYTELDIWAWESESYDALRKILPFHYAVPEDAAFSSAAPELMVWTYGGITHLLAAENGRFLGAATHPAEAVTEGDVGRFLKSLDPYGVEIQKIRIYGELPFSLKQTPDLTVANETDRGYPPCIAVLPSVSSREFRARGEVQLPSYQGLLLRIVIYCILGYGLFLYLTVRNFDQSTQELRKISRQMDRQILMTDSGKGNSPEDFSEVLKELNEKRGTFPSPVRALDLLARVLPKGSYLNTVFFNGNNLEVWILSREPLDVLRVLAQQKEIRNVRLKGPLNMEQKAGQYAFSVAIEMAG